MFIVYYSNIDLKIGCVYVEQTEKLIVMYYLYILSKFSNKALEIQFIQILSHRYFLKMFYRSKFQNIAESVYLFLKNTRKTVLRQSFK